MNPRRKFWLRIVTIILVVSAIFLVPYKLSTSPQWLIQVVGGSGKPISGLRVNEEWSYFGIDLAPWMDHRLTDAQGRVAFPRRAIWASLASRLLNYQGARRVGPSVWVLACDETKFMEGEIFWDGNRFEIGGPEKKGGSDSGEAGEILYANVK